MLDEDRAIEDDEVAKITEELETTTTDEEETALLEDDATASDELDAFTLEDCATAIEDPPATELLSPLTEEDEILGAVELEPQETRASVAASSEIVILFMCEVPRWVW